MGLTLELPVGLQAGQLAQACLLGLILSILYDLLRAVRRQWPRLTLPLDLLFVLLFFVGLLFMALYPGGGMFRIFLLFGLFLGVFLYFLCLSPLLFPLFSLFFAGLKNIFRFFSSKTQNFFKKIFSFPKKYYRIHRRNQKEQETPL